MKRKGKKKKGREERMNIGNNTQVKETKIRKEECKEANILIVYYHTYYILYKGLACCNSWGRKESDMTE